MPRPTLSASCRAVSAMAPGSCCAAAAGAPRSPAAPCCYASRLPSHAVLAVISVCARALRRTQPNKFGKQILPGPPPSRSLSLSLSLSLSAAAAPGGGGGFQRAAWYVRLAPRPLFNLEMRLFDRNLLLCGPRAPLAPIELFTIGCEVPVLPAQRCFFSCLDFMCLFLFPMFCG